MSTTTFVQEGNLLDYTPAEASKAGDIVFRGAICGQVTNDVEAGGLGALRTEGVIRVAKQSADEFDVSAGAAVHWHEAELRASTGAQDGLMGTAVGGGAVGEEHVDVKLNV